MEEKISKYYTHYTRAKFLIFGNTRQHLELANKELVEALEIRKTKEAFILLISNCIKLRNYMDIIKYSKAYKIDDGGFSDTVLGNIYTQVKEQEDFVKGIKCYEEAIKDFLNAEAYLNLSKCYQEGIGVEKDVNKAASLLEEALTIKDIEKRGEIESKLGDIYFEEKKYKESFEMQKSAIEHGYLKANSSLAKFYKEGLFVKKDLDAFMDCLLAYSTEYSLFELGGIFLNSKLADADIYIVESCMFYAANYFNSARAYFMLAGIESCKEKPDGLKIKEYLTKGFSIKNDIKDLDEFLNNLENIMDKKYIENIRELAKKYWNKEKILA